jgi:hypothetical protein
MILHSATLLSLPAQPIGGCCFLVSTRSQGLLAGSVRLTCSSAAKDALIISLFCSAFVQRAPIDASPVARRHWPTLTAHTAINRNVRSRTIPDEMSSLGRRR